MKLTDGRLKINFENGKVVSISTNANLDSIYGELIQKARKRIFKNSKTITDGIELVVFGSFYLEAVINERLFDYLHSEITSSKVADHVWDVLKVSNIYSKLSILTNGLDLDKQIVGERIKRIKSLLDLRNRLAHFKDSDFVWNEPLPDMSVKKMDALKLVLGALDNPQLIQELTGRKIRNRAMVLNDLMSWAVSLRKKGKGAPKTI